jgi:hypothetical protein
MCNCKGRKIGFSRNGWRISNGAMWMWFGPGRLKTRTFAAETTELTPCEVSAKIMPTWLHNELICNTQNEKMIERRSSRESSVLRLRYSMKTRKELVCELLLLSKNKLWLRLKLNKKKEREIFLCKKNYQISSEFVKISKQLIIEMHIISVLIKRFLITVTQKLPLTSQLWTLNFQKLRCRICQFAIASKDTNKYRPPNTNKKQWLRLQ